MLAFLDGQDQRTARLVCKAWRDEALRCRTHLNLNVWRQNTAPSGWQNSPDDLARCLGRLPKISHLSFHIRAPDEAALLRAPSCSSALKQLHIDFTFLRQAQYPHDPLPPDPLGPIAHLTGLTHFTASSAPRHGSTLVQQAQRRYFVATSIQIMQQCTGLRTVILQAWEADYGMPQPWEADWGQLLPHLANLPHLTGLGYVSLWDEDVARRVANLSQLTFVLCTAFQAGEADTSLLVRLETSPLLALPALRAVELQTGRGRFGAAAVQHVSRLTRLVDLGIVCPQKLAQPLDVESVLAPLTGLTSLQLLGRDPYALPRHLWLSCLGTLQRLRWVNVQLSFEVVPFPSSLRLLELHFDADPRWSSLSKWDPCLATAGLIDSLPALTRLTMLRLSLPWWEAGRGWTSDNLANRPWRVANFVTKMSHLVYLSLENFLHVENVERDVQCLAMLTGLRYLGLHDNSVGLYNPFGDTSVLLAARDEECRVKEMFTDLAARGGFSPLLSLAGLKTLSLKGKHWRHVLGEPPFLTEFNEMRKKMGRPPLNLA